MAAAAGPAAVLVHTLAAAAPSSGQLPSPGLPAAAVAAAAAAAGNAPLPTLAEAAAALPDVHEAGAPLQHAAAQQGPQARPGPAPAPPCLPHTPDAHAS